MLIKTIYFSFMPMSCRSNVYLNMHFLSTHNINISDRVNLFRINVKKLYKNLGLTCAKYFK